jgi:serine/threonine-protein kinase
MLASGTQIEGFRIDEVIGRGGMGVVYRATQLSLQRQVALKLHSTELSSEASFRERFRREARIQAALDHPNVVPVYDSGESPHGLYIAMQLIRGASLKRLIDLGKLDVDLTLEILRGAAAGLDAAHRSGLIHRDVKPQNILVVGHHAYLADFGLTKAAGLDSITETDGWLGTLDYMAPEQIRGEPVTAATDIYALGCVMYECMCGRPPFAEVQGMRILWAHLQDPPPDPRGIRADIPEEFSRTLLVALEKDSAKRPQTAGEYARMLAAAAGTA